MNKDRMAGSAKSAGGGMKQAAGKAIGSKKMQAEGMAKKAEGKIQNAAGKTKDAIKDANKKAKH